ncbi:ATP-grasp domain-containing protein [Candidatus Merdisoma sp. HCP28S3_D10]|uniref:ATP-grasp domain-containing protein n=1 Tax=unclassified Candidatus Merdisoma TaxID=3099611 RepID=UPI003F8A38B3
MKKKKIVIIGANSFQNPLILKAKAMGYETHVFAWKDGSIGERTADYFYPVSIIEREAILEQCRKIQPDAVASIGSDLAMLTVNYVAEKLGLPGNSMECTEISTNKYAMRKAFQKAGVPVPGFREADQTTKPEALTDLKLPVIVKPTDRSGSRGITKVTEWGQLADALQASVENSFEKKAIIEEYLNGPEYSCECISFRGTHHFLAVTKKYTTGEPHFIETGHLEPAPLSEEQREAIKKAVFAGLDALKVENGASHTEFKLEGNEVRIIEIGARMGGDCIGSDLVELSTGYDFVRMVIEVASGRRPTLERVREPKTAYIHFIFTKADRELLQKLEREIPEKIHFISEMEEIHEGAVTDSSTRFGYFILAFDSLAEAKEYVTL